MSQDTKKTIRVRPAAHADAKEYWTSLGKPGEFHDFCEQCLLGGIREKRHIDAVAKQAVKNLANGRG